MDESTQTPSESGNAPGIAPSGLDFPIIGIGASAGGLQSLLEILEKLPPNPGMAFVVVFHLSPRHRSTIDSVLQRATGMPVTQVTDRVAVQPDHVYVIPPNKHLSMNDGHLALSEMQRPVGQHVAIDIFFRTLADTHRERAIAIVLSGTGADGAVGLSRLKEQGGVTIVQHPSDAEYDGMPLAAISTGMVDFILPTAEIAQKLVDLWTNARAIRLPPLADADAPVASLVTPDTEKEAEEAMQEVIMLLRSHTGHDFRQYKRATVLRRIERRLQVRGVPDLAGYRSLLNKDPAEYSALLKDMLIGVTNFFRDREAFSALELDVVPELLKSKRGEEQLRAWIAACSTGEEAFSLAMLLSDQAAALATPPQIQIFASDIDERAIAVARAGLYPASIVADVSPERLRQYFTREDERYRICKAIRDKVLFASHNLLRDPPFSRLDLISCRNLLIYLNREMQTHVLEMLHFSLNPGGYLFLGSSESAEVAANLFTPLDKKNRIYRARPPSRAARYVPSPPSGRMGRAVDASLPQPQHKRRASYAEVHQRALAQHAPPSVIVNTDSDILHMSDRAGRFLCHVGSEPSRNVISLVHPELRLELRTALFQAQQSRKSVEARRVQLRRDERIFFVNMTVRPFRDEDAGADLMLVLFDEVEQTMSEELPGAPSERKDMVLAQIEKELQRTREQLQETIEHSEISNEELRASNEELQAINEELRSATEELETSKEELQSVNEELVTVNHELKVKVEETGKVNDDLNNLIASADIATIFVDRGMRINRYTPRASDIFNIIPSDVGRSLLDITHKLNYPELTVDVSTTLETLRPVEREVRSNQGRYYIVRLLPYRTIENRIEGAVMTFFDISSRRRVEELLRAGEERMRVVAESMEDYAIITFDNGRRVTSWNKGAERMFGYTEKEMLGESADVIFTPADRAAGVAEEEMRRAREEGRVDDERWQVRKDGTLLYCSGVMAPLRAGGGEGYARIARDQTQRIQMEYQREAALSNEHSGRAHAERANAMKDEFLAIMSHELRHPLNLIHMSAELLSRLPEVRQAPLGIKATETIRDAVASQTKIIDDLLDLSRLNTGKLTLSVSDVDLSALTSSIVEATRAGPAAGERNIALSLGEAPVLVRADKVRIEQVLQNLLNNALKFTPPSGNIAVALAAEGNFAHLEVVDDGRGIAPEFLPYVFDMFEQGGRGRNSEGLGIGLSLVRQIVELHGGRVEVHSPGLGLGARFTVCLPLQHASTVPERRPEDEKRKPVFGRRILLVDDMAESSSAFSCVLELEGAQVHAARSAAEGLRELDKRQFDLLISDISMPDMDGYAFMREVRKRPAHAALPAIAMTGLGRESDAARAYDSGFSAHISKPVALDDLYAIIAELLPVPGKRQP